MVLSLAFLAAVAVPMMPAQATCVGAACASEGDSDSALLQTKHRAAAMSAVHPEHAIRKSEQRAPLMQELNLESIVKHRGIPHHSGRRSAAAGANACKASAEALFDDVTQAIGLAAELQEKEMIVFRERFVSTMQSKCKEAHNEESWLEAAARELERQKPLMSQALADSLNGAGLGFETKMQDWLLHETPATFEGRLGLLPVPEGQESILQRPRKRSSVPLPRSFYAEKSWPMCREAILRIHNQGHCGSCWAFGGMAAMDARMCIASGGAWNQDLDILSRLHVTSCAPEAYYSGADGCQGGWPHWGMEMAGKGGVVSTSCLPYYISGEGSEHFEHKDKAPPCETHCQMGYSLPMSQDRFSVAGAENYDWLTDVHGDQTKMQHAKEALYTEGPISFAFNANHAFMGYHSGVFSSCTGLRANHAVYAYGWDVTSDGMEFLTASNSWGSSWGVDGHFLIHFRCVTDVIIPGTMEGFVPSHEVGNVDSNVAPDPENENWPWKGLDHCPTLNGCVTDMEGDGDYALNEECVSNALNGKRIRVAEFDTETGFDILTVNGQSFSGHHVEGLDGLVVDGNGIKFTSDFSINHAGFKLCEA